MKYLVYIRPSQELIKKLTDFRSQFRESLIEQPTNSSHVTIMTSRFKEQEQDNIQYELQQINYSPFDLTISGFDYFNEDKFVLRIDSKKLKELHEETIESLRKYIDRSNLTRIHPNFKTDDDRISVYKKYGSPYYGQFFNPHLTAGKMKSDRIEDYKKSLEGLIGYKWKAKEFLLSRKEEGWKLVETYPLDHSE
jgi:2'-5' RNA ligase